MFDDMIYKQLTDHGQDLKILLPIVQNRNRTIRVATMCSGTESPILALDMLQKSIHEFVTDHADDYQTKYNINIRDNDDVSGSGSILRLEHVFSCEIEPFKQAYIERNFSPPVLFRDIRELGYDQAYTAYGALHDVPNQPGDVDILIAGTSCVDYSNLNIKKVSTSQKTLTNGQQVHWTSRMTFVFRVLNDSVLFEMRSNRSCRSSNFNSIFRVSKI